MRAAEAGLETGGTSRLEPRREAKLTAYRDWSHLDVSSSVGDPQDERCEQQTK